MMKFIRVNDLILELQRTCSETGNWRVESIGATSNGEYTFHIVSDGGEKQVVSIDQFEKNL